MYENDYYTDAPAMQDGGGLGGMVSNLLGWAGQVSTIVKDLKGGEQQNLQVAQQAQTAQAEQQNKILRYVVIAVVALSGVGLLWLLLRKKG